MRAVGRSVVVSLLVVSLANLPAAMAANRALGFILVAQSSQIDGVAAASGATVFPNDALSTASNGAIRLQCGANQVYMPAASAATVASAKDGLLAVLSAGTLEFAAPLGAGIALRADDVLVSPKSQQSTHAQVTVLAKNELRIASVTGPLTLTLDDESYALAPGHTYDVKIVDDGAQEKEVQNQPARKRHRRLLVLLLFGGAATAAVIIVLAHHSHVSDYTP